MRGGIVADTIEISGSWRPCRRSTAGALAGLTAIDATIAASAHQSHSYVDGGCLYFTSAGRPAPDGALAADGFPGADGGPGADSGPGAKGGRPAEAYYRQAWDAVLSATTRAGGALSHHHGIGLNRARYMPGYLGAAFDVLVAVKSALDPERGPEPRQTGPALPVRSRPLAVAARGQMESSCIPWRDQCRPLSKRGARYETMIKRRRSRSLARSVPT